jgi:hypothetical protein
LYITTRPEVKEKNWKEKNWTGTIFFAKSIASTTVFIYSENKVGIL